MFARSYIPYSKLAGLPMFLGALPFAQKEIGIDTGVFYCRLSKKFLQA